MASRSRTALIGARHAADDLRLSSTRWTLKGLAIRSLRLDRRHFVGAASVASLIGDLTKVAVYARAELIGRDALLVCAATLPRGRAGLLPAVLGGDRGLRREVLFQAK